MPAKRRRRFQGLYYHSSPPKVLPMNGQIANENGRKRRDNDVKLSTIRIWMHEKDIGKLTRILWAGQGQRLRQQASTNPKVKRFLTAVPYVMNSVKDVHQAVIDNSLETLQAKLEPPVPPALVTCRDANGLNLIHKAAGLGHATILEYLITTWPDGVHETDITGKIPLHWAASAKNNMRCYTLLTQAGCDEEAVDYKMKTPSFYRHKPHDIERAFLTYVPEAPRVSPDVATDWEALSDDSGDGKKLDIKIPEMNGFGRHSNAESNENTSEAEMAEGTSGLEDEEMSKEDDGEGHESEALTENEQEKEAESPELETTEENDEEEPKETEQEEQQESEEPPETTEEQEDPEEEEAPDEKNKDDEEEPQDDKQQTLTLNDTTTPTPMEDAEAEHDLKSNDENSKEESNTEHEEESYANDADMNDTENENKDEDNKENEEMNEELNETKESEENEGDEKKEAEEEDTSSMTVGETLEVIKEELKDNVKYLANKVKNVFTQNEEETNEKETAEEKHKEEKGNEETTNEEQTDEDDKEENGNEENNSFTKEHDDIKDSENNEENNTETNEMVNQDITNNKNEEDNTLKENDKENNQETPKESENLAETDIITTALKINDAYSNSIKEHAQNLINSPSKETHLTESAKSEINKTAEDENNNHTKEIENLKETTEEDFEKINKSLQEYIEDKETSLEETQQGIEDKLDEIVDNVKENLEEKQLNIVDKLEEISDNVKDNIKDMANKVTNIFTSSSEEVKDKLDNETTDVVVRTESPTKQLKTTKKESESSDETADEDEATQAVETNNDSKADIKSSDVQDGETNAEIEQETTDNDEREGEGSPTSSLAIEGFVQGEAEDNTVQSQTAAYVDDDEDTRLQNIIASGDMEQLAQIVLNGDGQKLLDVEATEPEIQAFLKNVPNYMALLHNHESSEANISSSQLALDTKIRRVHEASRSGSLLNLQQALDRRKFAIAKDEISPNGATPLHVAVLFGHSDIVRYLSARFPETTTIKDVDDRTALHYAAVINDNGHFYNVLLQLGANPKEVDKMGHSPEDYFTSESLKDTLSYGQLLKNFGAEELEGQLLSDQGQIENHSYQENPLFKTEQGKYLADNLADPLIKALTQVAQKRPNDPLEYLTNYLQTCVTSRNTNGKTKIQAAIHSGSSQTNSTALVNSKSSTPPVAQIMAQRQLSQMNGHVKYDNTDEIEEDSLPQIDAYDYDDDDGNDSDAALSKKLDERDEHGQSMLHFASARSHRKGGLIHLIEEAKADITYRDELYRTARDVALQANQLGNAKEIDRYLISLVIVGDLKPFEHFALSGYDHIIDVVDDNEMPVIEIAESKGHMELAQYLRTIRPLEELREELHQMIRDNNVDRVMEIANDSNARWLIKAKNYYGRTALHIAILKESEEIIEHFVNICPEALKIGDNLERTALHYAMGTNIIESISRILIQNGAKRTYKDLKGRQPSYYFMNKADILRLQEEEDENR